MKAQRFDVGNLAKSKRRHDGTIRVDARLTRTGVFPYADGKGGIRLEYRSPEEVFKADSLATLELVPVTNTHPTTGVRADNAKGVSVGSVGQDIRRDNDFVRGTLAVHDAKTISEMDGGKDQLSCGYRCEVVMAPGVTPDGLRYDAIQKNIVYDHVAIVDRGRAGPDVRARMDAALAEGYDVAIMHDDEETAREGVHNQPPEGREGKNMKFTVKIDGIDYTLEGDDSAKQAVQKHLDSVDALQAKADADVAKADAEKEEAIKAKDEAEAKADAAAKALEDEKAQRADAATAQPELVRARVKLEKDAAKVLDDVKADASDADIKREVAAKAFPKVELEGKNDHYIECLFDQAIAQADAKAETKADAKDDAKQTAEILNGAKADSGEGDTLTAKQRFDARMAEQAESEIGAYYDPETQSTKVSK